MKFATLPRIQCPRLQTSTVQTTKSLRLPCEKHHFGPSSNPPRLPTFFNPHKLLRLPRILQRLEIPAPATRKALWTSKNVPTTWCFNDFDFQIALARRRGANFRNFNFQKCPAAASNDFDFQISRAQAWCKFWRRLQELRTKVSCKSAALQKCHESVSSKGVAQKCQVRRPCRSVNEACLVRASTRPASKDVVHTCQVRVPTKV